MQIKSVEKLHEIRTKFESFLMKMIKLNVYNRDKDSQSRIGFI